MRPAPPSACGLAPLLVALVLPARGARAQVEPGGKGGGFPRPLPALEQALHVLDRVTFGHTAEDLARIRELGVGGYLREQLRPDLIPESEELEARLAALGPPTTPVGDPQWTWTPLITDGLLRDRYSRRQLAEVMTEFWSNHFNTSLDVARAGQTGLFTSLAVGPDDRPVVCGYDRTNTKPHCSNWDGSAWQSRDADSIPRTGWFTSVARRPGGAGPCLASYHPAALGGPGDLRYACFDGQAWTAEVVDAAGDVGAWASLRIDASGTPRIAYRDATRGALKLATREASTWRTEVVDPDGGWFASLALDAAMRPVIAHFDPGRSRIRLARWSGSAWTLLDVATVGLAGFDLAATPAPARLLAAGVEPGSDAPAVAWYDPLRPALRYAAWDGTGFPPTIVDAGGDVGLFPALAFHPASGEPVIAYQDRTRHDARLARRTALGWTVESVDASKAITGEWMALAFGPGGLPGLSWYNGSRFSLEFARHDGTRWIVQTVESLSRFQFVYAGWEREETGRLRARALGRFRDLLDASAKGPAMMLYLNNDQNTAGAGNENYARELLELHTVGVDGGYDQGDVERLAQALTGWGVVPTSSRCDFERSDFCYNHRAHDGRPRTVLGIDLPDDSADLPANWMRQGDAMLDALACHPATARFLCRKLIEKFVDDEPPARLLGACVQTWTAGDGDIGRVLETILLSEEFLGPDHRSNKVRTPLEFVLAPLRHLGGDTDGASLFEWIVAQGAEPFRVAPPTGYAETAAWWLNSNTFLARWKYADWLANASGPTRIDPLSLVRASGLDRADAVVDFLLQRLVRGVAGDEERAALLDCLSGGDPGPLDLADPALDARLREAVGLILGLPEYHKQ